MSQSSNDLSQLVTIQDFEDRALKILPICVKDYYSSGEGEQFTIKWNRGAYKKYRIKPRVLRNVSKRDLSTTILGEKISIPIGISPTAYQKMAHPDGECGNAKAAEAANSIYILSSYSTTSIEEVAKAAPNAIKWLQILIFKDKRLTLNMIKKAEDNNFKALVFIVDNPVHGRSKCGTIITCLEKHIARIPILEDCITIENKLTSKSAHDRLDCLSTLLDDSLTWDDVTWLKSVTKLPIVLKGILTPEDALLGVQHGANAIFISNHGGRQLDSEPATIEVLSDIVKAIDDQVEVYVDGGITKGIDAFKALALGAKMVFLGKSMLWGLACGGENGARAVLEIMRKELDHVFAITGCSRIEHVTNDMVVHESYFNH